MKPNGQISDFYKKGTFKVENHTFKPKMTFTARIKYDRDRNIDYIELPRGYVFVGEGAEVEIKLKWLNKETVSMASWTPEQKKGLGR